MTETAEIPEVEEGTPIDHYLKALEVGRYNYNEIIEHEDFIFTPRYQFKKPDLNIIIGCCGRQALVNSTLEHLRASIANTPSLPEVEYTICEMGDFPLMQKTAQDHAASYIFIPFASAETENKHSEGLSHNLSYLLSPRSTWYDFHCADTVVPLDWFNTIQPYLEDPNTTFLQPFSERRLKYINGEYTNKMVNNSHEVSLQLLQEKLLQAEFPNRADFFMPEALAGAPGGSLFLRMEDFESVGGYDPEIFWGWAPEDTMMWTKQEYLHNKENFNVAINFWQAGYCHLGKATYPREKIFLFHLDHAPSPRSKHMMAMKQVCDNFFKLDYEEKLTYFSEKRKLLQEDRALLNDVRNY